ncbi:PspC domain-containing protein [Corynebacterium provencense]|uniref:PspC domain-containing protein n=1 Tax=Corynebacterium provencense TaxID=1737425 RepID=UPI000829CB0C|nr:PspC domain-containing protein [Corynebacterium provencense]
MDDNLENQFRRMWDSRPRRLPRDQSPHSWLFGVCEGIAVRYQISPVLVRVVLGLSVFLGGLGLWVYLAALLVFPRYGVPLSPAEILMKNVTDPRYAVDRKVGVRTGLVVVVMLVLGGLGSSGVTLGGVLGGALVTGVVWWLLHQRLPEPPGDLTGHGTTEARAGATGSAADPVTAVPDLGSLTPAVGFAPPRTTPPSWDPLGAAPFAWDLPDPQDPGPGTGQSGGTAEADPGGPGSRAAGTGTTGSRTRRPGPWRRLVRTVLAGVTLVAAAGVVVVVALWAGVGRDSGTADTPDGATMTRSFTGSAVQVPDLDRDRTVEALFSDVVVDLTGVEFPADRDRAVLTLDSRFSNVRLEIPESTAGPAYRIRVNCTDVKLSDIDCDSTATVEVRSTGGGRGGASAGTRPGQDATSPGVRELTLDLRATASELRMRQHPTD